MCGDQDDDQFIRRRFLILFFFTVSRIQTLRIYKLFIRMKRCSLLSLSNVYLFCSGDDDDDVSYIEIAIARIRFHLIRLECCYRRVEIYSF